MCFKNSEEIFFVVELLELNMLDVIGVDVGVLDIIFFFIANRD